MNSPPDLAPEQTARPRLGVVIVAFQSDDVIADCLDSLAQSIGVDLTIVVVDNASTDGTCEIIRGTGDRLTGAVKFREIDVGAPPPSCIEGLTLLRSSINGGYAYGVNRGLEWLLSDTQLDLFWILNPDCIVAPDAAANFARHGADGRFSLMGGRTVYVEPAGKIQNDGGRVSLLTGVCSPVHLGLEASGTPLPNASEIDFVTGANCVASRRFIEQAGPMREDYFLYYEEVDWALRRGSLPLRIAPETVVRHHGGTTIGSGSVSRRASAFANYLNFRNRTRFIRRYAPFSLPIVLAYAAAKAAQLIVQGAPSEAQAVVRGAFGLSPPKNVRRRLPPEFDAF